MEKNQTYAYIRVAGFSCRVEDLTQRIGLEPSESWHAGELAEPSHQPRKTNAWHLYSRLPASESLERHVMDVLDQMQGREAIMRDVANEYGAIMECVGYFHEYHPGFWLDATAVQRLGECGLALDLDFYCYFADKEGGTAVQEAAP